MWLGCGLAVYLQAVQNMAWKSFVEWSALQGLVVQDVVIEGRDRTLMNDLQRAIKVQLKDPLLFVDVQDIQASIKKLPVGKECGGGASI